MREKTLNQLDDFEVFKAEQKKKYDELFGIMTNDELYAYASDKNNNYRLRDEALARTVFNFDKVFTLIKGEDWNYRILPALGQIEDNYESQEQLGDVAIWLAGQKGVFDFTVESFCQYINDDEVKEKVKKMVIGLCHEKEVIKGLNDNKRYSKKNPMQGRY